MMKYHLPAECPWRDTLLVVNETGSTNSDLKAMAANGAPHGTVLVAHRQTAGRGRMGRTFLSPTAVFICRCFCVPGAGPTG